MNTARIFTRRPIFRCLNPPPTALRTRPQFRHVSSKEPVPRSKSEADLLYRRARRRSSSDIDINLDHVSVHRAEAIRRAYLTKRRNKLLLGAVLSMLAPIILVRIWPMPPETKAKIEAEANDRFQETEEKIKAAILPRPTQTDSPRSASESFQGKKVVIGTGDKILAAPESSVGDAKPTDPDAIELVPTGTSYVPYFPKTVTLPDGNTNSTGSTEQEYTLLGLGIRKVSFLRVQVYILGLYICNSDLHILQNALINTVNPTASALIPGEKDDLRAALLDPDRSTQIWESILEKQGTTQAVRMAWRVVPVRGTDFKHLQDGWMRGVAGRTDEVKRKQQDLLRQQAVEQKVIALPKPVQESEFDDESFGLAMKEFKGLFQGRGKAAKGSVILLTRNKEGVLGALYQPLLRTKEGEREGELVRLGEVRDQRVGKLVWLMYLGGKNVSSEDARRNIVEGCVGITERPVGTVEGMVQ
ncbi:chalcone-flavanone isomerase-domain-containing protein [Clohesyomyces aquaticus]|uniref:Chalcone-flavanone isomerase-domain-containing protein n=1 Tax=Clohesyomyces aquaticus TaxID=1231657 RepID=A0A1Y1YTM5_9PLEO|nr:chalcone-flavanone isomerase-domain-containing protein [Clohesyomyces aquaticus]